MNLKLLYFKRIIFFIFIGIFNYATPGHGDDSASLVLAGGSKGTPYYRFSVLLADQLNRNMGEGLKVSVIPTQGSVEGLNLIKRHTRPNPQKNIKGGIVEREAMLHMSNVQLVCPECSTTTRIGHQILDDGRKVRFCRKCDGVVDK